MSRVILVVFVASVAVAAAIEWNEDVLEKSVDKRGTCRDKNVACRNKLVRHCSRSGWVRLSCPLSCKTCKISKCNDKASWCPGYQSRCKRSSSVKKNCPRTCGLCGSKPQHRTTPRPRTKPPCNPRIKENRACSAWKRRGFCSTKSKYFSFMRSKCPGACGLCRLPIITTKRPVITKGAHSVTVNINDCLRAHNAYRDCHGVPPLKWDTNMAQQAQNYALKLAKMKRMKHASGIPYGENLAMQSGWSGSKYTCEQATKAWYGEVKYYSYSRPRFSMSTGHFTQVVWKKSQRLGVGLAKNGDFTIIVARYDPRGNYGRQFRENVLPPRRQC